MPEPNREGRGEPAEENLWPVIDDDELPPVAPSEERTRLLRVPPHQDAPITGRLDLPPPPPQRDPPTVRTPWPPPEPPRAAPVRIEPEPEPAPVRPAPRRRGRPALLVAAVLAVVCGLAAGVVFAVPGLSDKLGFTDGEPEIVLQPPPPPVEFIPALRAPGTQGQPPSTAGLRAALAGPLAAAGLGTLSGVVLDPATGTVLWQQNPDTALVPASTGKLITGAAALLSLGHTEQLTTTVVAGQQPGSVVIVGGGDPTLSSLKVGLESVYPGAAHLSDLVDQVKAAAGPVRTVYVDMSRFAGPGMAPSWDPRDVPAGHIAPIVPAMLDGGRADATAAVSRRTDNPARALAEEFARRIGATVPADANATAPPGAEVLGEVRSAPMVELVDTVLQRSDNVLAETIAREVAKATGAEPSFAGASRALTEVLRQNGFDTTGLTMADASGLSGQDKVSAGLIGSILAVAASPNGDDPRTAKLRPLLGGLPVAGGSGTLAERYNTPGSTVGRGWVRAKTGTLSEPPVNSLAGVVLDTDGRLLVFTLLSNGSVAGTARPALDAIAATLRSCGCR